MYKIWYDIIKEPTDYGWTGRRTVSIEISHEIRRRFLLEREKVVFQVLITLKTLRKSISDTSETFVFISYKIFHFSSCQLQFIGTFVRFDVYFTFWTLAWKCVSFHFKLIENIVTVFPFDN